jgi:hypothetical protein
VGACKSAGAEVQVAAQVVQARGKKFEPGGERRGPKRGWRSPWRRCSSLRWLGASTLMCASRRRARIRFFNFLLTNWVDFLRPALFSAEAMRKKCVL